MRFAACISARLPEGDAAAGHGASKVRSTHESGTESDVCETANEHSILSD